MSLGFVIPAAIVLATTYLLREPKKIALEPKLPEYKEYVSQLDKIFRYVGEQEGIDWKLLKAVAHKESTFNPKAVSSAGAMGLMQLTPITAKDIGFDPLQMFNPMHNVMAGARYLKKLLKITSGNIVLALAGYNSGPTALAKRIRQAKEKGISWYDALPKETKNYIPGVAKRYALFGGSEHQELLKWA